MKRCSWYLRTDMWTAWSIAALVLAAACPPTSFGADRTVICEEFTDTS